jgi:hypothetical protein
VPARKNNVMDPCYQKTPSYSSNGYIASRAARHQSKAFICCKDSASSIRQRVVEFGCSLAGLIVLSVRDSPALNTWDAVARALPPTIRLLIVDDVEHRLECDQRNAPSVLRLIRKIRAFAAGRGIYASVSTAIDLPGGLTHGGTQ